MVGSVNNEVGPVGFDLVNDTAQAGNACRGFRRINPELALHGNRVGYRRPLRVVGLDRQAGWNMLERNLLPVALARVLGTRKTGIMRVTPSRTR